METHLKLPRMYAPTGGLHWKQSIDAGIWRAKRSIFLVQTHVSRSPDSSREYYQIGKLSRLRLPVRWNLNRWSFEPRIVDTNLEVVLIEHEHKSSRPSNHRNLKKVRTRIELKRFIFRDVPNSRARAESTEARFQSKVCLFQATKINEKQ